MRETIESKPINKRRRIDATVSSPSGGGWWVVSWFEGEVVRLVRIFGIVLGVSEGGKSTCKIRFGRLRSSSSVI